MGWGYAGSRLGILAGEAIGGVISSHLQRDERHGYDAHLRAPLTRLGASGIVSVSASVKGPHADELVIAGQFHEVGSGRRPRHYQRIAVNRTLEAIAKGQRRLLLVMATGTGKTYTAAQIIWRFMEYFRTINPGKRQACVLFLADRNILIDQTVMNDIAMVKGRMAKLSMSRGTISKVANPDVPEGADTKIVDKSFELYLSLYQAVSGTEDIDNVYRGSAREDSAWRGTTWLPSPPR